MRTVVWRTLAEGVSAANCFQLSAIVRLFRWISFLIQLIFTRSPLSANIRFSDMDTERDTAVRNINLLRQKQITNASPTEVNS